MKKLLQPSCINLVITLLHFQINLLQHFQLSNLPLRSSIVSAKAVAIPIAVKTIAYQDTI